MGEVDEENGEFWVENPFMMPAEGLNLSAYERNRMYLNLDGDSFLDASFASRADLTSDSRGVISADFDRDGRPDLLVLSVGGGPLRMFLNRFPDTGNRRVRLDLIGKAGNRRAIGARVVLHAGGRRIVRDRFAHNGGFGQAPPELNVGVGKVDRIDRLVVRWPDGSEQTFTDLPVDRRLTLEQGSTDVEVAPLVGVVTAPSEPTPPPATDPAPSD